MNGFSFKKKKKKKKKIIVNTLLEKLDESKINVLFISVEDIWHWVPTSNKACESIV